MPENASNARAGDGPRSQVRLVPASQEGLEARLGEPAGRGGRCDRGGVRCSSRVQSRLKAESSAGISEPVRPIERSRRGFAEACEAGSSLGLEEAFRNEIERRSRRGRLPT